MSFSAKSTSRGICLAVLLLALMASQPAVVHTQEVPATETILGVFKEVLKNAAQWGLDEAGTRILGNSAWKFCKTVLKPTLSAMEVRYPLLFDAKSAGSPGARTAALQAVNWIEQDKEVHATLDVQLRALREDQRRQLEAIIELKQATAREQRRVNARFERIERQLADLNTSAAARAPRTAPSQVDWFAKARLATNPRTRIVNYTEAINRNQNLPRAYFERGFEYFRLKDFNSAHADFSRALDVDASFALAYTNRGASAHNLGRLDDAIADYYTSIRLDSKIALNYSNLKQIYASRKDHAAAYAMAKLQLQHEPDGDNRVDTLGELAWYALLTRDFHNAVTYSQRGLALDPTARWIDTNLAHAFLFTGQVDKANALYYRHSGIKLGDRYWEEVILEDFRDLQSAGVTHPDISALRVDMYGNLSYHLLFERRFADAAKSAQAGLQLDPVATWIESNLAHAYLLSGSYGPAMDIYRRYKGQWINKKTWKAVIIDDFDELVRRGISHPDMARVRAVL